MLVGDALFHEPGAKVSFAKDYRELWISSKYEPVHVVLLHNSLCSFELEEAARPVRGRWPTAKILIIRSGEVSLDDALYDDRLVPPVAPKILFAKLSRILAASTEGDSRNGDR